MPRCRRHALGKLGVIGDYEDEVAELMCDRSAAVRNAAQAAMR